MPEPTSDPTPDPTPDAQAESNTKIDVTLLTVRVMEQMLNKEVSPAEADEILRVINFQYPQDCPHCGEPLH